MFKRGRPPEGVEVAWLMLGDGEGNDPIVELCAYDGEQWCGTADWKGESTRDPIAYDGLVILGWMQYEIPKPVLEPENS